MFKNAMRLFYKKTTIWILAAGTAIMIFVMMLSGRPLNTPQTPGGILCLEFASTGQKVEDILSAWKSNSIEQTDVIAAAKNNTYLDFIFLLFYSLLLCTCCLQLAASMPDKKTFSFVFNVISLFALLAGLLDIFENVGMLKSLSGHISDQVAIATVTFAAIKWIVAIGVILLIAGGAVYRRSVNSRKV